MTAPVGTIPALTQYTAAVTGNEALEIVNNTTGSAQSFFMTLGQIYTGLAPTISTAATTGFLALPQCAGTPTGVPSAGNGVAVFDTTNNKFWVYNSGWLGVTVT